MTDEDQTQEGSELFDTSPENGSPTVSTTEDNKDDQAEGTESSEDSKSEENEGTLNLDEGASDEKQKQIDAWFKKIQNGEATLDDIKRHQKWIRPHLEERLELAVRKEDKKDELNVSELVKEELRRQEEERQFKTIKDSLQAMSLSGKQKGDLEAEYKDLREAGLDKATALEKALKLAGVKDAPSRRNSMTPPRPSTVMTKEDGDNWRENLSDKERIDKLNQLTDPTNHMSKKFN